ncbi:hypothetical protein [Pseudomonas hamedanensis]|uniref:Uncharacterized protein n=1 Tax=Pseudomonas hamedanensis TaxID=2745504 RepID=A0A9E6NYC4_9PSED|nr:hypothetical protein [Pseudomonas hamedanensis]QXI16171.1 hypothetical protein HU739_019940 [Pseudomonas hamedanensis]
MSTDKLTKANAKGNIYLSLTTFQEEEFIYSIGGKDFLEWGEDYFRFGTSFSLGGHNFYIGSRIKLNAEINVAHKLGELGTVASAHLKLDEFDSDKQAEGIIYLYRNGAYPKGVICWSENNAFSVLAVFDFFRI